MTPDGLVLAAVPERADARDALVGIHARRAARRARRSATGSVRRRAQLAAARPDLAFAELRGNIETRLEKAARLRRDRGRGRGASTASAAATASPSGSIRRCMLPRSGRARSRSSAAPTTTTTVRALARDRRRRRARRAVAPSARSSPSSAAGATCPCAAYAIVAGRDVDARRAARVARRPGRRARPRRVRRRRGRGSSRWRVRCSTAAAGSCSLHERAWGAGYPGDERGRAARREAPERDVVTVYLVGAGPGDPGLLTVAGAALLARADVVVYDRLASPALLELAPGDAELISAGKAPGQVELTQDEINALLVERGQAGGDRRAAQGRRPVRVRPRRRGGRGARRRRRPVRGRARHHERDRRARVRGHPGDPSRACRPTSRSSPATRTRPRRRPTSTGTRSRAPAARS